MIRVASLGRAAPVPSLGLLVELMRGAKGHLQECAAKGEGGACMGGEWGERGDGIRRMSKRMALCALFLTHTSTLSLTHAPSHTPTPLGADTSAVLEQLVWLLQMSAHVLADSGAGETPLMPLALLDLHAEAEAGGQGAATLQVG
jgi:hypothetical protein